MYFSTLYPAAEAHNVAFALNDDGEALRDRTALHRARIDVSPDFEPHPNFLDTRTTKLERIERENLTLRHSAERYSM